MKIGRIIASTALALTLCIPAGSVLAMNHGAMGGMGDMKVDHSKMMGKLIHESTVGKVKLVYHLMENKASEGGHKMPGMSMESDKMPSHHLMLYPLGEDGKPYTGAKVGFQLTGPKGEKQQAMAVDMTDGYGANVDLKEKGNYQVKLKMVKGDVQVLDEFSYEVK